MTSFGKLIRQARKDKDLSQRDLAKLVGVNYTYLSKLENDHAGTPPSEEVIHKIAEHLELNAQELQYLAGRITPEEAKVFEDFIKHNYQEMPVLFRKMRNNPNFAKNLLDEGE